MIMRRRRIKAAGFLVLAAVWILTAGEGQPQQKNLVVEDQETRKIYAKAAVKPGDEVAFEWEHSFEHIPWHEYYEVEPDGSFLLHTISVAGFGAGIPAEMDCTYRYADGLIYMEGIESRFPQFNWIHSQTALKEITVNGELLLRGSDLPHHKKMMLSVK